MSPRRFSTSSHGLCWLAAWLFLGASAPPPLVAANGEEPAAAGPRPNLVLLTLDTTRDDVVGAGMGAKESPGGLTPHLDRLAASGVRFTRCDASSPLTLPSHASLFTGLYPPRHGVRDNGGFRLDPSVPTVIESLAEAGYQNAAVVSASVLTRGYGLARGFADYDDDFGAGWNRAAPVAERTAESTVDVALSRLAELDPLAGPFLLWVHFFDPHSPYSAPASATPEGATKEAYLSEIETMDAAIGRLLAALPKHTFILAVGDHGEMLGEHGEAEHGLLPFKAVRRVPFILAGPGLPEGRRVDALVRTVDVAPTLLELAGLGGLPGDADLDGKSVLPLLEGEKHDSRFSYWESFYPFFAFRWYPLRALSDGDKLYVDAPRPTLYDLAERPDARRITASKESLDPWRRRLETLLSSAGEAVTGAPESSARMSRSRSEQLAALGYLGGLGGGAIHRDLLDPRDLTAEAERLRRAAGEVSAESCPSLLEEVEAMLENQPENPAALLLAGRCQLLLGAPKAAQARFRAAGDSPLVLGYLADALFAQGRKEAAIDVLYRGHRQDPGDPRAAAKLARWLRQSGRAEQAREVASQALEAGAGAAQVYFERALALRLEGEKAAALADFEHAMRRAPHQQAPLANGARLARELGRLKRAAELYALWLRLDPDHRHAWREAAEVHESLGQKREAVRCYRRALALETDAVRRRDLESKLRHLGT